MYRTFATHLLNQGLIYFFSPGEVWSPDSSCDFPVFQLEKQEIQRRLEEEERARRPPTPPPAEEVVQSETESHMHDSAAR